MPIPALPRSHDIDEVFRNRAMQCHLDESRVMVRCQYLPGTLYAPGVRPNSDLVVKEVRRVCLLCCQQAGLTGVGHCEVVIYDAMPMQWIPIIPLSVVPQALTNVVLIEHHYLKPLGRAEKETY